MRHLLLISVLLLGVSWAVAQNYPSQTSPSETTGTGGGKTTVQGCLNGSGENYMLTDKNGNTFHLTGDTAKLSEHVGHEVKVTGTVSEASASPSGETESSKEGEASSSSSKQTLEVSSVTHVSKTCQSSGEPH